MKSRNFPEKAALPLDDTKKEAFTISNSSFGIIFHKTSTLCGECRFESDFICSTPAL